MWLSCFEYVICRLYVCTPHVYPTSREGAAVRWKGAACKEKFPAGRLCPPQNSPYFAFKRILRHYCPLALLTLIHARIAPFWPVFVRLCLCCSCGVYVLCMLYIYYSLLSHIACSASGVIQRKFASDFNGTLNLRQYFGCFVTATFPNGPYL